MKTYFATLLGVLAFASAVVAQVPAESSTTLTADERGRVVGYLAETQKDFLAAIDGLSEEQWRFKAAPDRWSIAETAEHIAVAEGMIWKLVSEKIMKSAPMPEKRGEAAGKDEKILQGVPERTRKAQAPEVLQPTGKYPTQAALTKDFAAVRDQEIAFLRDTKEDLRNRFEEHPFLKTMDAYQWLLFNGAHSKRHTAQILEVKADPNFPKK